MTERQLSRREREDAAAGELAEQLDALSRPLAERVLGRAIELDAKAEEEARAAADTIDYETLKSIALEVGISEEALRRALLEEMNTERDHDATPLERATVPDAVRGGLVVPGDRDEIGRRLGEFLRSVEGLEERSRVGGQTIWVRRRTGGPGRTVESWTVTQSRGDRQLVEIDVETRPARRRLWVWLIAISMLAGLFGTAIGSAIFFGVWIVGIVVAVGWVRRMARKARRSINRALNAVIDTKGDPPREWLDVWEKLKR